MQRDVDLQWNPNSKQVLLIYSSRSYNISETEKKNITEIKLKPKI